jgi:hypothetical protein
MTVHADIYEEKTGTRLYPGSLNVVLERPWHVTGEPLRLEPPVYAVGLSIVPCRIEDVDAFILRTDKNDVAKGTMLPRSSRSRPLSGCVMRSASMTETRST